MKKYRRERGQALVLIVLAIVGMLGFAALAVDVGRVFAERRRAQNAADAAAFAAALAGSPITGAAARQTAAETEAEKSLGLNDYVDSGAINVDNGGKIEIEVWTPPISGVYEGQVDYYQVIIHQEVDKVFAQFVFSGLMKFTVEAVTNSANAAGMFEGSALVATSPDSCGALWFAGKRVVRASTMETLIRCPMLASIRTVRVTLVSFMALLLVLLVCAVELAK